MTMMLMLWRVLNSMSRSFLTMAKTAVLKEVETDGGVVEFVMLLGNKLLGFLFSVSHFFIYRKKINGGIFGRNNLFGNLAPI